MKELTLYTAGIIDSVIDQPEIMEGWRNQTMDYFSMYNVKVLNPTRRPHTADLNDKEIFNLDLKDINESDIILADCRLHQGKAQFGTPVELFYMNYILKRPVIGWYNGEEGYRDRSVFQNVLVDRFFPSLEEALDHISTYYLT